MTIGTDYLCYILECYGLITKGRCIGTGLKCWSVYWERINSFFSHMVSNQKWSSHLPGIQLCRFRVSGDLPFDGIPGYLAAGADGDIAHVADGI